jgi:hypothetical protein
VVSIGWHFFQYDWTKMMKHTHTHTHRWWWWCFAVVVFM